MSMFQKISTILIWSEDFRKLANWYKDTFSLTVVEELDHPRDTGVLLSFPEQSPWLWIGQHSQVKGKNPDPPRHMFNMNVDSVSQSFEFLTKKGVKVIAKPFKAPTFDKYFATLADPDGNYFQIIGKK